MFIENCDGYYDRHGEQRTRKRLFLILIQRDYFTGPDGSYLSPKDRPEGYDEIRAIVRKVAMRQCGHFMMGSARVKGEIVILSGAYGGDGNTCTVSEKVFAEGVPVPADLLEKWNKGGGWNGAGSEADAMREWARENLRELYKVKKQ